MISLLAQASDMTGLESEFVQLVDRALADPALLIVAVAAAFAVGAVHALAPGHGKAIAAAYLVGGRGRTRDAFLLGATVSVMHTISVVVLALGLHLVLRRTAATPDAAAQVTPVLRVVSGLVVAVLGVVLLAGQWRRRHTPEYHDHEVAAAAPLSRKGLIALGVSGGLLPSPSAFLVLLTTGLGGRLPLGLLLVTMFSLGLATTLTLIGLAVVRGREALVDRVSAGSQRRFLRAAAWIGAVVVLAGGVVLTAAGVAAL